MKSFLKSILCLTLICLMFVPLFMFSGCTRNYTISVNIIGGEGDVLLKQTSMVAGTSKSVVGNNVVSQGEKFEFLISPKTGWQIKSIKEDDVAVSEEYDRSGAYRCFVEVKASHKVEIEFEKVEYTITFKCKDGENFVDYTVLTKQYNDEIDLNGEVFGGQNNKNWYKIVNSEVVYLYNDNSDPDAEIPSSFFIALILFVCVFLSLTL